MKKAMNQVVAPGTSITTEIVRSRILAIRGVQVLLDRDLAEIYGVTTKALNQAVKRNASRFPEGFAFKLDKDEFSALRSQNVTSKRGGARYLPYVFTEHGVVMLASVLKSPMATEVSVRVVNAFVEMRRFLKENAMLFSRLENVEQRQIATEGKVNEILNCLNERETPVQGVFYDGQLWDARSLVLKLIAGAKRSLVLIDNWATAETLDLFTKKSKGVKVTIITSEHYKKSVPHHAISDADVETFNAQYPKLSVRYNETFHDRFLIVDDRELYLIGASLKDLGRKCFGFTKMDSSEISRIRASAFAEPRENPS